MFHAEWSLVVSRDAKDSIFFFFSISGHKNNVDSYKFHKFFIFQLEATKKERISERLLFFRCFMRNGPLLYPRMQKIRSFFVFL